MRRRCADRSLKQSAGRLREAASKEGGEAMGQLAKLLLAGISSPARALPIVDTDDVAGAITSLASLDRRSPIA